MAKNTYFLMETWAIILEIALKSSSSPLFSNGFQLSSPPSLKNIPLKKYSDSTRVSLPTRLVCCSHCLLASLVGLILYYLPQVGRIMKLKPSCCSLFQWFVCCSQKNDKKYIHKYIYIVKNRFLSYFFNAIIFRVH